MNLWSTYPLDLFIGGGSGGGGGGGGRFNSSNFFSKRVSENGYHRINDYHLERDTQRPTLYHCFENLQIAVVGCPSMR